MKIFWALCLSILGLMACTSPPSASEVPLASLSRELPKYAKGFFLEDLSDARMLHIISSSGDTSGYFLYQRPSQLAQIPAGYTAIHVPITSVSIGSSTQIPMLKALDALDCITAVARAAYIWSPEVLAKIDAGTIAEIGEERAWDMEALLTLGPQVIMVSDEAAVPIAHKQLLAKLNTSILPILEWREHHPLGRAEWMKVIGALLDKDSLAHAYFTEIENRYQQLSQLIAQTTDLSSTLSGIPYEGVWYVPGGKSYVAQLLHDAKTEYAWANNTQTASLALDFEAVYPAAMRAQTWLLPSSVTSFSALKSLDQRYASFPSFQARRVYSSSARINAAGANDYFESGVLNPHIILSDLIHILHPKVLPDHQLYYYQALQ